MSEDESPNDIFYYASEGNLADMERVVKRHKDWLSHRDIRGRTVIMHAAIGDNLRNLQFLMRKGLSLWDVDNNGDTALHWATQCSSIKVVRYILQSAKSPQSSALFLIGDKDSVTPMHIAAASNNSKILQMFTDIVGPTDDVFSMAQDKRGRGPLHYAASRASLDSVRLILDSPSLGLPVDAKDHSGLTPLMCAVGVPLPQAVEVCRLLARRKAMAVYARNRDGLSSLHLTVVANNLPVLRLLVEELHCDVEIFDNEMRTPLHYAAEQGQLEMVRLLIANGARNTTRDKRGAYPAHYAAQYSVNCLDLILAENKYVDVKDQDNRSCLMWAVCAGNVEVIQYLVYKTAPDRQDRDNRGYTALHLAAMVGNENICKLLVKQGWNLTERDKFDNTPLHLAAGRGHTDVVRFLVTAGANMNEKDAMSRTPVYWACFGGQAHTLYCMIKELGFEWRTVVNQRRVPIMDVLERTPLHAAAFAGFSACINVLLSIEAEDDCLVSPLVGWKDKERETALHVACARGRMDCVLALLKGGAALNAMNDRRKTPLQCALDNRHLHIVDYLRTQDALLPAELEQVAAKVIQRWCRRILLKRKITSNRRKL